MSRWVRLAEENVANRANETPPADTPVNRLVKYIPAEIVSAYTLLYTNLLFIFDSSSDGKITDPRALPATGLLIALFFIVTVIYIWRAAPRGTSRNSHLLISPIAYLAWVYPISSLGLGTSFNAIVAFSLQAIVIGLSVVSHPKRRQ